MIYHTTKQRLILNLHEDTSRRLFFQSKEETCKNLRQMSGEDFGENVKAWEKWLSSKSDKEIDDLYHEKVEIPEQLVIRKIQEKYAKKRMEEENEE
jgi:hypothetical protein